MMKTYLRRCRAGRMKHEERGSTLIFVLCMVVVVSVAGAAVLRQASSSNNVQHAYQTNRDVALTAEQTADSAIQTLRSDGTSGVDLGSGDLAKICTSSTGFTRVGSGDVYCKAAPKSGESVGTSPGVPPYTVLVLGGTTYVGNRLQDLTTSPATNGFTNGNNAEYYYPNCDNFHNFQNGSADRCEAGLYVGRNVVNDTTGDGELVIQTNGTWSKGPLVRSNSSIVLSNSQGSSHKLIVSGPVQARRQCGWGAAKLDPSYVVATSTQCNSDSPNVTQNPFTNPPLPWDFAPTPPAQLARTPTDCTDTPLVTTNCMWPDPDWVHEPLDPMTVPRVDAGAPAPYTLTPTAVCNDTRFAVMPALQLPAANDITWTDLAGNVQTTHMYSAWYDNVTDLNAMMSGCDDTLFWFRPGVYYFDFLDVVPSGTQPATRWLSPDGCIPLTSCGTGVGTILGGYPKDWNPCTPDWSQPTFADLQTCQQPSKPLYAQTISYEQGSGFALVDTNQELDTLDDQSGKITLSGGFNNDGVNGDNMLSPIPRVKGADIEDVNGVQVEVAYDLPAVKPADCGLSSGSCYKDSSIGNNMGSNSGNWGVGTWTTPYGPGAELHIRIGGTGAGACFIHLPAGNHTRLVQSVTNPGSYVWHAPSFPNMTGSITTPGRPNTDQYPAPDPITGIGDALNIDLTNGCNTSVPGFEKVNNPCATITSNNCFPVTASGWNAHPEWLDFISIEFLAATGNSTPAIPGAEVSYNGSQLNVKWHGRPAPVFPGGCDVTAPGAQWIFGGTARIDWKNTDMFAELCANKQSAYSGVPATAPGADYGVGIYGISEDSAGPPRRLGQPASAGLQPFNTNQVSLGNVAVLPNPGATVAFSPTPSFAKFGTIDGTKVTTNAVPDATTIGQAWTGQNPLELNFKLPFDTVDDGTAYGAAPNGSIVCSLTAPMKASDTSNPRTGSCPLGTIPWGSQITQVKLKIRHYEGEKTQLAGGSYVPCAVITNCFLSMHLKITPGKGIKGNGSTGSNGSGTGTWNTAAEPAAALNPLTIPMSSSWTSWQWGNNTSPTDWSLQRDLTDALSSPEALAGAVLQLDVSPKNNPNVHYFELDGLELEVTYRGAGTLRPLSGCLTTRTQFQPTSFTGLGSGGNTSTPWATTGPGGTWEYYGGGHDWLDTDWGTIVSTSLPGSRWVADEPIGDLDGGSAGNGATNGARKDCALVNTDAGKNHQIKFHVNGSFYAPSAAFSLSGFQNDAAWASDAIVARQLSALRWKKGKNQPSVGDGTGPATRPRKVTIVVCPPGWPGPGICTGSDVRVRALVQFDDLIGTKPGYAVNILSWVRDPG